MVGVLAAPLPHSVWHPPTHPSCKGVWENAQPACDGSDGGGRVGKKWKAGYAGWEVEAPNMSVNNRYEWEKVSLYDGSTASVGGWGRVTEEPGYKRGWCVLEDISDRIGHVTDRIERCTAVVSRNGGNAQCVGGTAKINIALVELGCSCKAPTVSANYRR